MAAFIVSPASVAQPPLEDKGSLWEGAAHFCVGERVGVSEV